MSRGGHNRVPSAVHQLRGNWRPDRMGSKKPSPAPFAQRCPRWLDREAKRIWRYLVPKLQADGCLSEWDRPALELLCASYSVARQAAQAIAEHGVIVPDKAHGGTLRKSPALQIFRDAAAQFGVLAAKFGITPADRQRIEVLAGAAPPDPLEQFLQGGADGQDTGGDSNDHPDRAGPSRREDGNAGEDAH